MPGHLGHDEHARAHDRRHDLAARAGDGLDGRGILGGVAALLHQRDREGARGVDIGHGRARDRSEQRRADHGDLGRSAARPARQPHRHVDDELAHPRFHHHRGEEHVDEQDIGGDAGEEAVHPLVARQVHELDHAREGVALEMEDAREPLAGSQIDAATPRSSAPSTARANAGRPRSRAGP